MREVAPKRVFQIHELLLSEFAQQYGAKMLGGLIDGEVTIIPAGDAVTV